MKVIAANGKTYSLKKKQVKEIKENALLNSIKFHSYKLGSFATVLVSCSFYCD